MSSAALRSTKSEKVSQHRALGFKDYQKVLAKHATFSSTADALTAYFVRSKIGEGAFGEVFEAEHKASGKPVALKLIKLIRSFDVDNGLSMDLIREIKILACLAHHPHVVQLLDSFFSADGDIVMVFEYMHADLSGLLATPSTSLQLPHVQCILFQLTEAIRDMHEAGFMHRDLKTSNVLLGDDGTVKLADFGLATNYRQRKRFTTNAVTLAYRPPELLLGQEAYGPSVDVWALGCIAYELVTRRVMFAADAKETAAHNDGGEQAQLTAIARIVGLMSEATWPGVTALPLAAKRLARAYTAIAASPGVSAPTTSTVGAAAAADATMADATADAPAATTAAAAAEADDYSPTSPALLIDDDANAAAAGADAAAGATGAPPTAVDDAVIYGGALAAVIVNDMFGGDAAAAERSLIVPLMQQLLAPEPSRRIDAAAALRHPFFDGRCHASELPAFASVHEYEVRAQHKSQRK